MKALIAKVANTAFEHVLSNSLLISDAAKVAMKIHGKDWATLEMMYGPTYPKTLLLIDLANLVRDERHATWVDLGGP